MTNDPITQNSSRNNNAVPLKRIAFLNCNSQTHTQHWSVVGVCSALLLSSLFLVPRYSNDAVATLNTSTADVQRLANLMNSPNFAFPEEIEELNPPAIVLPSAFAMLDSLNQPKAITNTFSTLMPSQSPLDNTTVNETSLFNTTPIPLTALIEIKSIDTASLATPAELEKPQKISHRIVAQEGDTLAKIFKRLNLSATNLHAISNTGTTTAVASNIKAGEQIELDINENQQLTRALLPKNLMESVELTLVNGSYQTKTVSKPLNINQYYAEGTIKNSFYLAAQKSGLSDAVIMELVKIFTWDIDFAEDIHPGDKFEVIYERKKVGSRILSDQILAARFTNQGKITTAIAFIDGKGEVSFYTPDGMGMKKPFKRNPVDFARISSYFDMGRFHPILHTIRAHKGVDYAAKTGTPVKASGDGRVIFAGRKGGYGNTIILQHGSNITTLYGHLNKFASGITVGAKVKQDQVIGQVGSSGMATGPHLHYEFLVAGENKNPLTVKLAMTSQVSTSNRSAFNQRKRELLAALDQGTPPRTLAQLNQTSKSTTN